MSVIPDALIKSRRALDGIKQVSIIHDWKWDKQIKKWYLELLFNLNCHEDKVIPSRTIWFAVIEDSYPLGSIKIYPSVKNNWDLTLYHQANNGRIERNNLWRKGALCLDPSLKVLGRYCTDGEPNDADTRLAWYVKRAVKWIYIANENKLVEKGDPFELPDFDTHYTSYVAFSEDYITFMQWESTGCFYGYADLLIYKKHPTIYNITTFYDTQGRVLLPVNWGSYFAREEDNKIEKIKAIWLLLNNVPVINGWQAPNTFGELIKACKTLNINLLDIIKEMVYLLRDGKAHILLVGFPIPEIFGGEKVIINWQAIKLPILSHGKYTANGFRTNEKGYWLRDKRNIFKSNKNIYWLKTQNWNASEINNRGKMSKPICSMKTLIIGAGAIGSSVGELLTRAGSYNITFMDYDILEIGNLSRHSLELRHIGNSKAEEMAKYLHRINPHSVANFINEKFSASSKFVSDFENYDLIIDCTGEDDVLLELSKLSFKKARVFASISVGFAAKRLYLFFQRSNRFNSDSFYSKIYAWLEMEKNEFKNYELPRDGVGCWSPLFPARYDDILLASSTFVKVLEEFIDCENRKELIRIYELYKDDDNFFVGYRKVE
jgi:hypothetical protein